MLCKTLAKVRYDPPSQLNRGRQNAASSALVFVVSVMEAEKETLHISYYSKPLRYIW